MTLAVSLNQVGILRATEILHEARTDAALRHETEPKTVSVDVARLDERAGEGDADADGVASQPRIVDLRV